MKNLEEEKMRWLTELTGRHPRQTQFLFELVDYDFEKLKLLESQIKNCFVFSCPGDKEEVERVMKFTPKMNKYRF